ncbi:VQ motif-containing protein 10-like [Corylus avellana]|uniref:VQ motif-containing protein 10-like n=1 Tax=Corylus avellana TaxID=13451 RepID=UPI001E217174|nr:VQ motif-containing protein 10-like [Corylus avellana]
MACVRGSAAVKVVLIETQYVETDPMSFKSVVQSLTGKDSCVAKSSLRGEKRKRRPVAVAVAAASGGAVGGGNKNVSMLTKGMSFKDLDKMILEAPPMEELVWLWAE